MRFDHLTMDNGLSESIVLSIIQDKHGYMWFGTADGLNRYDGYSFTVFKHDPEDSTTIAHNYIQCLYEDQNGILWIGTLGGLDWFDSEKYIFRHYRLVQSDSSNQKEYSISGIRENPMGVLWIGAGENLFQLSTNHDTNVSSLRPAKLGRRYKSSRANPATLHGGNIGGFEFDLNGRMWTTTLEDGANILDTGTQQIDHLLHNPLDVKSISSNRVATLLLDSSRNFWIGTENGGLNRRDDQTGRFIRYSTSGSGNRFIPNNTIRRQYQDRQGKIWVATDGGGLLLYDTASDEFKAFRHDPASPTSIASDRVFSIYEDRSGTIWFGTWGAGVDRWSPSKEKFVNDEAIRFLLSRMKNRFIISFLEDSRGWLWVGTHGGGTVALDPRTQSMQSFVYTPGNANGLANGAIWSIQEDRNGTIWFATDQGVNGYDPRLKTFIHFDDHPSAGGKLSSHYVGKVRPDGARDVVWVATDKAIDKIDLRTRTITNYPYGDAGIDPTQGYQAGMHQIGSLIFLGTSPIIAFDTQAEQFVTSRFNVGKRPVSCIVGDHTGNIWVGTFGDGVFLFDSSYTLSAHFTEKDGLPNNVVYGVLDDDFGNYWMSTNKGLARLHLATRTFRNYDAGDGLQSNEFNRCAFLKGREGKFYFGGINGFNAFFPDRVADNPRPPPIQMTGFRKFDEPVTFPRPIERIEEIVLSHNENFFSFEFAALDFTDPSKNRYAYMLEGFDQRWVEAGTRRLARYTNVEPGLYTFRVKGTNSDGIWNSAGASVRITIPPPFWKTIWFLAGMVILGSGTFGATVRYVSVRKLKTRLKELEYQQKLQHERERISRDLHDNVGAQLVSIISGLDLFGRYAPSSDSRTQQLLTSLQDDARASILQLRETIWALKSSTTTLRQFADHIETYARRQLEFHQETSLSMRATSDPEIRLSPIQSLTCFRIIQEALTNIIKHAGASSIAIDFALPSPRIISVTILDDGCGISPAHLENSGGNGLNNMRDRVLELDGSITVGRAEQGGTQVRFQFPLSNGKIPPLGD